MPRKRLTYGGIPVILTGQRLTVSPTSIMLREFSLIMTEYGMHPRFPNIPQRTSLLAPEVQAAMDSDRWIPGVMAEKRGPRVWLYGLLWGRKWVCIRRAWPSPSDTYTIGYAPAKYTELRIQLSI